MIQIDSNGNLYVFMPACDSCGQVNATSCCSVEWIHAEDRFLWDCAEQHASTKHGWRIVKAHPQNILICANCIQRRSYLRGDS